MPRSSRTQAPPRAVAGGCTGQASVELVALLPVVVVLGVLLWSGVLAGQALWLGGGAARAAARAHAVGGDAGRAARANLPGRLERGLRVRTREGGEAAVTLRIPLAAGRSLGRVTFRARMEPQG